MQVLKLCQGKLISSGSLQPTKFKLLSVTFVFEVNEDLQELFKKEGITLLAANSFVDNPDNVIKDLKAR